MSRIRSKRIKQTHFTENSLSSLFREEKAYRKKGLGCTLKGFQGIILDVAQEKVRCPLYLGSCVFGGVCLDNWC